jgi:hypothetical protein
MSCSPNSMFFAILCDSCKPKNFKNLNAPTDYALVLSPLRRSISRSNKQRTNLESMPVFVIL